MALLGSNFTPAPGAVVKRVFRDTTSAVKLLETRTGRCGEFANAFSLICRALDYETRYILDWTDHVWTEIWSPSQNRWIHCDSCEAAFDEPRLYSEGWGKSLSFVVAFSIDGVADVSKRYQKMDDEMVGKKARYCSGR